MDLTEEQISKVVEEVLKKVEGEKSTGSISVGEGVVFGDLEGAVGAAEESQKKLQSLGLKKRSEIIAAMRKVSLENAEKLAKMAHEEAKMGRWEHKVQKNILAAEKTPGVEDLEPVAYTGDHGLTLVERAPFGVIAAVTPSTNPSSTIINNAISIISAGNSCVFAPHPAAKKTSQETMKILNQAIILEEGPANLITTVDPPTVEGTRNLLNHPKVKFNIVTGGPAIVKIAMGAGKKTIAAGPGNPPAIIDETAVFPKCIDDIILGATFDNGVLCTAEKVVVMVEEVRNKILSFIRQDKRAYELNKNQMDELAKVVMKEPGGPGKEAAMNREYIGRNANIIAKAIGLELPDSVLLLWGEVPNNHPFVWTEQLMPVLPFTQVKDVDSAIEFAIKVEQNNHHTFIMHSLNIANLSKMAGACQGSIFVKNGPSYMGLGMGEGYGALSIATPTGDGLVRTRNFTRPLRCTLVDYFRIA